MILTFWFSFSKLHSLSFSNISMISTIIGYVSKFSLYLPSLNLLFSFFFLLSFSSLFFILHSSFISLFPSLFLTFSSLALFCLILSSFFLLLCCFISSSHFCSFSLFLYFVFFSLLTL